MVDFPSGVLHVPSNVPLMRLIPSSRVGCVQVACATPAFDTDLTRRADVHAPARAGHAAVREARGLAEAVSGVNGAFALARRASTTRWRASRRASRSSAP